MGASLRFAFPNQGAHRHREGPRAQHTATLQILREHIRLKFVPGQGQEKMYEPSPAVST